MRAIERTILLLLRVALGGVFLWAAYVKLDEPQAFADSIKGFKLLPPEGDHLVVLATFAVPWVEMLAGCVLILELWSRSAALVLLMTLLAFIGAIVSVLERGISTKCGCFGKFSVFCPETITTCNIVQNSVLGLVALLIVWRGPGLLALDRSPKAGAKGPCTPPGTPKATATPAAAVKPVATGHRPPAPTPPPAARPATPQPAARPPRQPPAR